VGVWWFWVSLVNGGFEFFLVTLVWAERVMV